MRACRPGSVRSSTDSPGAFRAPQQQAEIDRRVTIYRRQVARKGRITWLPRLSEGD